MEDEDEMLDETEPTPDGADEEEPAEGTPEGDPDPDAAEEGEDPTDDGEAEDEDDEAEGEGALPRGVRQRLAKVTAKRRAAEARAKELEDEVARLRDRAESPALYRALAERHGILPDLIGEREAKGLRDLDEAERGAEALRDLLEELEDNGESETELDGRTVTRAQLRKDSALVRKTKRDLDRIRPLFEQNAASRVDLDNAIAAYETAVASMGMSRADLDQAEQELSYTYVRSPISGYISERLVDLGTLVGTSGKSLLATVVKSDTVLVDFSMTALDYLKSKERNVNLGHRDSSRSWQPFVTITLADNSVYPYKGLVDFAEPQVSPKTGTFSVRAEMPNPEHVLLPGQFTKVHALLDVREKATVVPQKALIIEKGGAYVFVMRRDSTAERRFIELGPEFGNKVVVERGLAPGETIISEGYNKLTPGMKVRVAARRKATREKAK